MTLIQTPLGLAFHSGEVSGSWWGFLLRKTSGPFLITSGICSVSSRIMVCVCVSLGVTTCLWTLLLWPPNNVQSSLCGVLGKTVNKQMGDGGQESLLPSFSYLRPRNPLGTWLRSQLSTVAPLSNPVGSHIASLSILLIFSCLPSAVPTPHPHPPSLGAKETGK